MYDIITLSDISEKKTDNVPENLSRKSLVSFASFGSDLAKRKQPSLI